MHFLTKKRIKWKVERNYIVIMKRKEIESNYSVDKMNYQKEQKCEK